MKKLLFPLLLALVFPCTCLAQILTSGYELTSDGFSCQEICKITFKKGYAIQGMDVYTTEEIWERVEESLRAVGMYEFRKHSPNHLSGGQKQRVSIAGVLAMHPMCIVLDEPTAMLDPSGRKEVIRAARGLNQVEGITVILITHYMEEIVHADKVYVMDGGRIAMEGTPREIFSQVEKLQSLRLDVPQVTLLAYELKKQGIELPDGILTVDELTRELLALSDSM